MWRHKAHDAWAITTRQSTCKTESDTCNSKISPLSFLTLNKLKNLSSKQNELIIVMRTLYNLGQLVALIRRIWVSVFKTVFRKSQLKLLWYLTICSRQLHRRLGSMPWVKLSLNRTYLEKLRMLTSCREHMKRLWPKWNLLRKYSPRRSKLKSK